MTSNDAPRPDRGPRPGRRRALGRGPAAAAPLAEETPAVDDASGTAGAAPAEQDVQAGAAPGPTASVPGPA
ncbi:hypothetical protein B9W62_30305, partial [Streptomyces sp. CS113]